MSNNKSSSSDEDSSSSSSSDEETNTTKDENNSKSSSISKPIATRQAKARERATINARKMKIPPSTISVPRTRSKSMKLCSRRTKSNNEVLKRSKVIQR